MFLIFTSVRTICHPKLVQKPKISLHTAKIRHIMSMVESSGKRREKSVFYEIWEKENEINVIFFCLYVSMLFGKSTLIFANLVFWPDSYETQSEKLDSVCQTLFEKPEQNGLAFCLCDTHTHTHIAKFYIDRSVLQIHVGKAPECMSLK